MPTIAEQGVPDYDHSSWVGISAPARVPPAIINKLNGMFVQALKDPKIIKTLEGDGTIMVGSTPEVFRRHIIAETNRWRTMIRESGIKMGD
jgi:tripartite-type tricarboxylate transporter receptor subunit TctC